jgi:EAL domain-containing protein (putative c-di-GMP-specific phosphodiesterase class I)/GGDEF domain-containing protein
VSREWPAWASSGVVPAPAVTSMPLGDGAAVRSRLFPKMRSWISLGFPLELVSPLSVLRIVFVFGALLWPLACWAPGVPLSARWVATVVGVVFAVGWWTLLRVHQVSRRASQGFAALNAIGTSAALVSGWHSMLRSEGLLLSVPIVIFAGLFFSGRAGAALLAVFVVASGVAWGRMGGAATGSVMAFSVAVILASISLTVRLLVVSARRHTGVDPDTGLDNGVGFSRDLVASAHRSFLMAVVSLTGLPEVREALGHQAGSELFRRAVEDLGQVIPPRARFARVEGDELVLYVPLSTPPETELSAALVAATDEAGRLTKVLLDALGAGRYLVGELEVSLGAHVGLAMAPWDGTDPDELVRRAAISARRARITGQRWLMWAGHNGSITVEDLSLLADLRQAAQRGELHLAYQPQIDARTGAVVAVEALIRWDSPRFGAVPPDRFIPLAERTGLIDRLTDWVFTEALDAQRRWANLGLVLSVAVNLSAKLLGVTDLAGDILAKLDERGVSPAQLTIEVTETAATTDPLEAVRLLGPLHDRGVRISIDDFGTGYTSLAVLPTLPLDELKVDRGFVARSSTSAADEAIVRSVRELGHRLGLDVVAEGVEDAECAARMVAFGFDRVQGFYLGRPLAEAELLADLGHLEAGSPRRVDEGVSRSGPDDRAWPSDPVAAP